MAIYNVSGTQIVSAYDKSGQSLGTAYDVNGAVVYTREFSFKVMQYNCGQWYKGLHDNVTAEDDEKYYELQSGMIYSDNPDVLCLEEYTAQFSKAGRTAKSFLEPLFPYYHEQTDGTTTTVPQRAIYSKYPITDYTPHTFTDGSGYYYDSCTITINGLPIHFIVTHLHWNDINKRATEAATIKANADRYDYVVICGDFNTVDNFDTSGADYQAILKPFVDDGYKLANGGAFGFMKTCGGTSGGVPVPEATHCLDNIIVSENITIDSVTVDHTKETDEIPDIIDHLPLVAELTIGGNS